jgi:hypothetical protein
MRLPVSLLLVTSLALAGCAPDSVQPSSGFDAWSNAVASKCNFAMIGSYEVGSLLGFNATDQGVQFLDLTSRLYFGRIGPGEWTQGVTTLLNGQPGDPGVGCVLAQLPKP